MTEEMEMIERESLQREYMRCEQMVRDKYPRKNEKLWLMMKWDTLNFDDALHMEANYELEMICLEMWF